MLDLIKSRILEIHRFQSITVVGIDGPTAAGKTTLANTLASTLRADGVETRIYQVDWALEPRTSRAKDLYYFREKDIAFEHEAALHMRLDIVEKFLNEIDEFNSNLQSKKIIQLTDLYSREHGGTLVGTAEIALEEDTVVFVEGHYTLQSNLSSLIHFNLLLLSEPEVLVDRKAERVKSYRGQDEAVDYFWRIDLPSFQRHLHYHGAQADLIVDTSDVKDFKYCEFSAVKSWIEQPSKVPKVFCSDLLDFQLIDEAIFSSSLFVDPQFRNATRAVLELLTAWSTEVNRYLKTGLPEIRKDLSSAAYKMIEELSIRFNKTSYMFTIDYEHMLANVYRRTLPVGLGVSIWKGGKLKACIFIEILQSQAELFVSWQGGLTLLYLDRDSAAIEDNKRHSLRLGPNEANKFAIPVKVFTPTAIMVPPFLSNVRNEPVYIGREDENVTPAQITKHLIVNGGVWINRFALFSEMAFFEFMLGTSGARTVRIGNYLICLRHNDEILKKQFANFAKNWKVSTSISSLLDSATVSMDNYVKSERHQMREIVAQSQCFNVFDDHLFSELMVDSPERSEQGLDEIVKFLQSANRHLRKRTIQFILNVFPNLTLPTQRIWPDLPEGSRETIQLDSLLRLSPSILAELYLWLSIRGEPSSVLGATVYDIRKQSADAFGFLSAASTEQTAVVLQASLNACGQKEEWEGLVYEGYLKPIRGAKTFIDACVNAARDFFLLSGKDAPLYSIGLDHVSAEFDYPKGRARRFLEEAIDTGFLTHIVLDGGTLFNTIDDSSESLRLAYSAATKYVTTLTEALPEVTLIDREISAGELSYIGKEARVRLPSEEDLRWFANSYQTALAKQGQSELVCRPTLFIGNLGTTHHGEDSDKPSVHLAPKWRDSLKKLNFISPVLHGTTNTEKHILQNASSGCHKINVAGDFLDTLLKSLPKSISTFALKSDSPKKEIPEIREAMDKQEAATQTLWKANMANHAAQIMQTINSPRLDPMDVEYFRYMNYQFTDHMLVSIREAIKNKIAQFDLVSPRSKRKREFSASMIEVPLEEINRLAEYLWNHRITNFHVDAGDGEFISRAFSGIDKLKCIRNNLKEAKIRVHLMIKEPHLNRGHISAVDAYIQSGCDALAVHPRAFKKQEDLFSVIDSIRAQGVTPGIVVETHDVALETIFSTIKKGNLEWLIVMGVPIGYGGQLFQISTLEKINSIRNWAQQEGRNLTIEVDGGLTLNSLRLCCNAGADIFSGWSILKGSYQNELPDNINAVLEILQ